MTWYDDNAERLIDVYEALDPSHVHGWLDGCLPTEPGLVVDVGAGSGRDAGWLASMGHEVIAVEPSAVMRGHAARLHPDARIRWLEDELPSLSRLASMGVAADFILVGAVWQHVEPDDRRTAFRSLAALLRPGGSMAITLRHGPSDAERRMHPTSREEMERLASCGNMAVEHATNSADAMGRSEVAWTSMFLRSTVRNHRSAIALERGCPARPDCDHASTAFPVP